MRLLFIAALALACASPRSPCDAASFAEFWSAFQSATSDGDVTAVERFVRFPLATRGPMDGDPVVQHEQGTFPPLWSQLLEQDPGPRLEPETLRDYINRQDSAPSDAVEDSGSAARVADLVFACRAGTWQLTMAFTAD